MKIYKVSLIAMAAVVQYGYGFEAIDIKMGSNVEDLEKKFREAGILRIDYPHEAIVVRDDIGSMTFSIKTDKLHLKYYLTV